MRWFQRAPEMVGELNDDQVQRWRDGDDTVWDEDSRGRRLGQRAVSRRDRNEQRERRAWSGRD